MGKQLVLANSNSDERGELKRKLTLSDSEWKSGEGVKTTPGAQVVGWSSILVPDSNQSHL